MTRTAMQQRDKSTFVERANRNEARKALVAAFSRDEDHIGGEDRPLRSVTFVLKSLEACYLLLYKTNGQNKGVSEQITLKQAFVILPSPVLYYLGVQDGRSVNEATAASFGLTCDGDDASCKEWGIKKWGARRQMIGYRPMYARREMGLITFGINEQMAQMSGTTMDCFGLLLV